MHDAYEDFLVNPDRAGYLKVRRLILDDPGLVRRDADLAELTRRCQNGSYNSVLDWGDQLGAAWHLCPRYHYWLATAAQKYRDPDVLELEQFQMQSCLQGLLSTGNGSLKSPFSILHTTDAYDIVEVQQKRPRKQQAVYRETVLFDVITCSDGAEFWFERGDGVTTHQSIPDPALFGSVDL